MYYQLCTLLFFVVASVYGAIPVAIPKAHQITIAAIGPWKADPTANFMVAYNFLNLTTMYLNSQSAILPNVAIKLIEADTSAVPARAILTTVAALDQNIVGFIGGARTPQQQIVSYLANAFEVPHVGGIVTGAILSDKVQYPYFMRTSLADQFVCTVMVKYILNMGWNNVILITQNDDYGNGNRQAFLEMAGENNLTTWTAQVNTLQTDFRTLINDMQQTRIRIVVLLVQTNEALALLTQMKQDGRMVNEEYVYLLGQVYFNACATIFDGSIIFSSTNTITEASQQLIPLWKDYATYLNANNLHGLASGQLSATINRQQWFLSEAMYAYAYGLEKYLEVEPNLNISNINKTRLLGHMRKLKYTGISGDVQFDENGDRLANCNIYNIRQPNVDETNTFYADVITSMMYSPFDDSFITYSPIKFFNGVTETPRDTPCPCLNNGICLPDGKCQCVEGFTGTHCDVQVVQVENSSGGITTTELIISIVIPVVVVSALLIVGLIWYKKKRALIVKEIADKQRSDIPRSSIKLGNRIGRGASGEVFTAVFRGTEVAVKVLSAKNLSQTALQQFQLETAIMTSLRHPNIILFMGSCFDKANEQFLLVMELCARGSLYDVLYNKGIALSMELQLHLAYQIVQGINFLHQSSPPIIHCDIKSHNVLLDEKWNCRICDFGITIFTSTNKKQGEEALGTVYWSAPEVLVGGRHSTASDSYSIGILLWEIFHRQLPFGGKDPLQVAMEVVNSGARPVMGNHISRSMADLITSCWHQDPAQRPATQEIVNSLRDLAMEKPMYNYATEERVAGAPTGSVVFVTTDFVESHSLWEAAPKEMQNSIKQHNTLARALIEKYKGYEVSFKDHSFLLAFSRVTDALNFCCSFQDELVTTTWPLSILKVASASEKSDAEGNVLWNGPRISMTVHNGVPQCNQDKISGKTSYDGPVMKRLFNVKEHGVGGVVLITKSVYDTLASQKLETEVTTKEYKNIGSEKDSSTYLLVPSSLSERLTVTNSISDSAIDHPYTVVDINEGEELVSFTTKKESNASYILHWDDIKLEDKIGVGTGAEVYTGTHKGRELAIKLLINQSTTEDSNLSLRYIAVTMSKVDHPNILKFIDICIVTEFMHTSLQKFSYGNNPFPTSEKIRIAKGVASAMQYLCNHEDHSLGLNQRLTSNRKNGEVKLADFAVNKLYDSNRTLTSVNAVAWTAPEMLNGDDNLSLSVAVYSFGIVLWEMITRKKPYATVHPIRLLNMVAKGHRPEIPNDCPREYASLMTDCWAGDPNSRPTWDNILSRLASM